MSSVERRGAEAREEHRRAGSDAKRSKSSRFYNPTHKRDQEERKRDLLSCTYGKLQCDLDVPVLGGAFAVASARAQELVARSRCKRVAYTAYFGTTANIALFLPPYGSEGCAFVFIHPGTAVSHKGTDDLEKCLHLKETYGVQTGLSWGTLPADRVAEWRKLSCDSFALIYTGTAVYQGTPVSQDNDVRQWTPIEVDTGALPAGGFERGHPADCAAS